MKEGKLSSCVCWIKNRRKGDIIYMYLHILSYVFHSLINDVRLHINHTLLPKICVILGLIFCQKFVNSCMPESVGMFFWHEHSFLHIWKHQLLSNILYCLLSRVNNIEHKYSYSLFHEPLSLFSDKWKVVQLKKYISNINIIGESLLELVTSNLLIFQE